MVTVEGADVEQRARLDDALARFDSAGLRLADFEIVFSDDESVCAGHLGGFRDRDDTPHVSVCSDLEFVVLHELAHVWIDANLGEVARDEYVRARGLAAWSDHSVPWAQRGVEDAAFVVQQNLRDVAPSSLASATWADRIAAFELLTGVPSPLRSRSQSRCSAARRRRGAVDAVPAVVQRDLARHHAPGVVPALTRLSARSGTPGRSPDSRSCADRPRPTRPG